MSKGAVIIANAVIWGAVIIACSLALRGTGMYQKIQLYLWGGVILTNMLLGGEAARKKKAQKTEDTAPPQE